MEGESSVAVQRKVFSFFMSKIHIKCVETRFFNAKIVKIDVNTKNYRREISFLYFDIRGLIRIFARRIQKYINK